MKNCVWILQLLMSGYLVVPVIYFFVGRKIHQGEGVLATLSCPMFYGSGIASITAFFVALNFYPSGMAVVSVFILGMGLMVSIAGAELNDERMARRKYDSEHGLTH